MEQGILRETPYSHIWQKALEIIKGLGRPRILEIGCGPGQFANYLFDEVFTDYMGIDFSSEAISMAKERNPHFADRFFVDDAYTSNFFSGDYDLVIMFEVWSMFQMT